MNIYIKILKKLMFIKLEKLLLNKKCNVEFTMNQNIIILILFVIY